MSEDKLVMDCACSTGSTSTGSMYVTVWSMLPSADSWHAPVQSPQATGIPGTTKHLAFVLCQVQRLRRQATFADLAEVAEPADRLRVWPPARAPGSPLQTGATPGDDLLWRRWCWASSPPRRAGSFVALIELAAAHEIARDSARSREPSPERNPHQARALRQPPRTCKPGRKIRPSAILEPARAKSRLTGSQRCHFACGRAAVTALHLPAKCWGADCAG